jgi:hypothetical protein
MIAISYLYKLTRGIVIAVSSKDRVIVVYGGVCEELLLLTLSALGGTERVLLTGDIHFTRRPRSWQLSPSPRHGVGGDDIGVGEQCNTGGSVAAH